MNMWRRVIALGMTLGMLLTSMPVSAYADEMIVEDDFYIVAEDDTEAMLVPEIDEDHEDIFDDSFISDEEEAGIEEVLGISSEETEEEEILLAADATSGTCGDNLTWSIDSNGTVTISGTGPMYDYDSDEEESPFSNLWETLKSVQIENGVTSIGNSAFESCYELTSIAIPDSVTSIGNYAFYEAEALTNITIPDSVMSIGQAAFMHCDGLKSITLSNNLTCIAEDLFCCSDSLTSITIPSSVTCIKSSAFRTCQGLISITIPSSVTSIEEYAFLYDTELQEVNYGGTEDQWNQIIFGTDVLNELENVTINFNGSNIDSDVPIDEEHFPDDNYRAIISQKDYDSNEDGVLSADEIAAITVLDLSNSSISSLSGTEYFSNLAYLYCSANQLTSLDVSACSKLTSLDCSKNQLTSLDVSAYSMLTSLDCSENQLTSLDVSACSELTGLYCGENQLKSLNVSGCSALKSLDCNNNQLKNLDLSDCISLRSLSCEYNELTSLDLRKNTELETIRCITNQLTRLDVSNSSALTSLDCDNNQLTSLDVSNNTALERLYCRENQLTSLNVSNNTALTKLSCSSNQLTSLDVNNSISLTILRCFGNNLSRLELRNCPLLEILNCSSNQIGELNLSENKRLKILECDNNGLSSLDISNNTMLYELSCAGNLFDSLDISNCELIEYAYLNGTMTTSTDTCTYKYQAEEASEVSFTLSTGVDITYEQETQILIDENNFPDEVFRNYVSSQIDLNKDGQLSSYEVFVVEFISVRNKSITTLKGIEYFKNIESLYCSGNQLQDLDLGEYSEIIEIECQNNQLTSLDVSGCPYLWRLKCSENQLTNLDVSACPELAGLYCDHNQLTRLDIGRCPILNYCYKYENHSSEDGVVKYGYWNKDHNKELWFDSSVTVITDNNTSSYTVTFNANGGSGAPASQSKEENVDLTLSSVLPTKNYVLTYNANGGSVSPASKTVSCTFNNWNTEQNGSGTVYAPGGSYTANSDVTLYAQWADPTAGTLATPTNGDKEFEGWFTSASGGEEINELSVIESDLTLYAHWDELTDPYNLGDETYSFDNYMDDDSAGHCFGMSITSAGYYNKLLDISIIGGDDDTPLYSFDFSDTVKRPICKYQDIQYYWRDNATVAGGSHYLNGVFDISSDWQDVVNYVKSHEYDDTGLLQIGLRKLYAGGYIGGHAVNFLRYENVNGQDRIYAYDNNFPDDEVYFYQDSYGRVFEAPIQTFSGSIDCIALRDVRIYYNSIGDYDATHALYMDVDSAYVQGFTFSYMDGGVLPNGKSVMYVIPADQDSVTIIPKKDNASFVYMNHEYSFGKVTDETYGILKLATKDDTAGSDEVFTVSNAAINPAPSSDVSEQVATPTPVVPAEQITISKKPTIKKPSATKNKITVNWKHFKHTSKKTKKIWKKIKKVQVQCATDKAFTNIIKNTMVGKKKTKTTIKGLAKKMTYYVRVRYYDGTGYSAWSGVKKVKTK